MAAGLHIFRLNPLDCESKYCFVKGAFAYDTSLQEGGGVLDEMKTDGVSVLEYRLDEDEGGLEIGDYFTTTTNHLPVSRRFADALTKQFDLGHYELVPARIRNEKKRIHVADVAIVNPLGRVDCLDWERSEIDDDEEDPLVEIFGAWSLKKTKVPRQRDLFRVKGLIGYLFSERLVEFIGKQGFKNFAFEKAALT